MHKALAALALLSVSTAAIAQDGPTANLTGELTITSRNSLDPLPGEKKDRVGLFITGDSAKLLYDAMKTKPAVNVCEDGMRIKTTGALECSRGADDEYICMIAVMLATGQSRPYGAC